MYASDVTNRASRILFDTTQVRWPIAELLDYCTDAERQIVLLRPDANPKNESLQLVSGSRQIIPSSGVRLLRVVRNMGTNGETPGRAIRSVSREAMDNELPDWHFASPSLTVQHYYHDNIDPKHFYVYPAVTGTPGIAAPCFIEAIYSAVPAVVVSAGQVLTLADHYLNPILDWVLYRAYSKDASYAGNMARAGVHLQNFANALQVTMRVEWAAALSPEQVRSMPAQAGEA